jgi:transcriptional regulator with XRE-family HTH domain
MRTPEECDLFQAMIANRLIRLRQLAGLTQSESARLLGISGPRLSNYESAHRSPPLPVLCDMARLYRAKLSVIVSELD